MVLFRNINKACSDLLYGNFIHEKPWEVDVKHGGSNPILTQNASVNAGGAMTASSALRYVGPWGFIDTKLATNSVTADVSFKNPRLHGVTLGSRLEHKHAAAKGAQDSVDVSCEFNGADGTVQLGKSTIAVLKPHIRINMSPILQNWTASGTTGVTLGSDITARLGAEVSGAYDLGKVTYSMGGSVTQVTKDKAWVAAIVGSPYDGRPFGKLVGMLHCKNNVPGATELGAEVTHYHQSARTDVAFAGQWYLNQPLGGGRTDTVLKVKLSQDAKVAMALTHKLNSSMTTTVGAQIDPAKLDTVKYGVRLNITA